MTSNYPTLAARTALREAAAAALNAKREDLPQYAAAQLATAVRALERAFVIADAADVGSDADDAFAIATANIAEAAAVLARQCAID
jgi:hypothetical protein